MYNPIGSLNTYYNPGLYVAPICATIGKKDGSRKINTVEDNKQDFKKLGSDSVCFFGMINSPTSADRLMDFTMDIVNCLIPPEERYRSLCRRLESNIHNNSALVIIKTHFRLMLRQIISELQSRILRSPGYLIKWNYPEIAATLGPFASIFMEKWVDFGDDVIKEFLKNPLTINKYLKLEDQMLRGIARFIQKKFRERNEKTFVPGSSEPTKLNAEIRTFSFLATKAAIEYIETISMSTPNEYQMKFLIKNRKTAA